MINKKIIIGNNERTTLTTYILDNIHATQKRPIILVCPGGGFLDCSPYEGESVAIRMNAAGYHAAVLVYSTAATAGENSAYPKPLYDLAEAISIVRNNVKEWNIDENKVVILGFSAGAYLCGLYCSYWNKPLLRGKGKSEKLKPNAVVLCYPLLDLELNISEIQEKVDKEVNMKNIIGTTENRIDTATFWDMSRKAQFGNNHPSEDEIKTYNPILHINEYTPPTFLWHTFTDEAVSPLHSIRYAEKLCQMNIQCELHIYSNGDHGLSLADKTSAKKESQINSHVASWSELAIEWIEALG